MKRGILIFIICFVFSLNFAPRLWAADYGALLKGELDVTGQDETKTTGNIVFAPWISVPFGESELNISAGLNVNIADSTVMAPELYRLEFYSRLSSLFSFRIGRFSWQDPSGFTARGRFDGVDLLFDMGKVRLGLNALYTGFLYKDTSEINISPMDTKDYSAEFDWGNFVNTYTAPRRLVASLYGEFPGFPPGRGHLYAGLMAQFDLSDADEAFHTQYLLLRHTLVYRAFDLDLAGAAELENTEADGLRPGFAFSLEGGFQLPDALNDRLSLGVSWASGEGSTAAFFPVTRETQSFVLKPYLSGMMILKLNYSARFLPSLSGNLGASYFFRTDSTSFNAVYLENDSYALGMELDLGLLWVPFSDLSFSLNGGIFLPKTGSAWANDAPAQWHVNLGMVFSF